jgi:N-acetylglucosamine-6-sulfatase
VKRLRRASLVRTSTFLALSSVVFAACTGAPAGSSVASSTASLSPGGGRLPPNIVVIVTDDQSYGTLPAHPAAMPWFQRQLRDPEAGWVRFSDAVISTPICCPSRATLLTGQYARHTGVVGNADGQALDETETLPAWLHDAGYTSGLIGKYLNLYPWDRGPYVPPGWDRWLAKRNTAANTTYYDYEVVDQGQPGRVGDEPGDYATTYLAAAALDFVRTAPADRPWFLYFAPSAPHKPWTAAPGDEGAAPVSLPGPSEAVLNDVAGKPAWIRALPRIGPERAHLLERDRAQELAPLFAVDRAIQTIWEAIEARGELDRTAFVFLSDNGYAYGEHRWEGKRCPYEECIRVPFAIRMPGVLPRTVDAVVSNVDVAPTVLDLAGVAPGGEVDGESLLPLALGTTDRLGRAGVFLDWAGDGQVPPWVGVRLADAVYIENEDGTVELYDLARDPHELRNVAGDASAAALQARASSSLRAFVQALSSESSGGG